MFKTLRGKTTTGIIIISIIVLITTNLFIWRIFEANLEDLIINDMDRIRTIMLYEIKKQYPIVNEKYSLYNRNKLWSILNTLSGQYDIYLSMNYAEDDFRQFAGELLDLNNLENIIENSNKKSSLLYISNEASRFYGTYSYPLYLEDEYIGIFAFQKDYINDYNNYITLIKRIIYIQIILYIAMALVNYLWLKRTTSSLNTLLNGINLIGEGEFTNKLEAKTNDEVAILIHHFNKMQEQLSLQMEYLKLEKIKIEELEKSSRDFFNYATHEMKTPITSITGYAQLLKEGNMDKDTMERAHSRIIAESERMHRMVQNMLIIARGKEVQRNSPQYFNLKDLLIGIIHSFDIAFNKNEIDISLECEDIMVFGVKEEIRTIIVNLIDNGYKYSTDGKIDILCGVKDNIYLIIENKCKPMPLEIKENLFEPFTKYNYENHKQVSSGLGLFICRELAEKNNGRLTYSIEKDKISFVLEFLGMENKKLGKWL